MALIKEMLGYIKNRHYDCYVISFEPLILTSYWHDFCNHFAELAEFLPAQQDVWFIFQIGYYKSEEAVQGIKQDIERFNKTRDNFHYYFLNNSETENQRFQDAGLNSRFINQNAFLDENRYRIIKQKAEYDAIYLARFTPVKRHYLAKNVKKLLLIGLYKPSEVEYYQSSLETLSHADYVKKVWGRDVTKYMNKAKVGLCLSDLEGAMFVSSEYLLSGLPVVSTASLGGRDIYYNEQNSRLVAAEAEQVAEAVYDLIANPPDREAIRNTAIEVMEIHRDRFKKLINEIYMSNSCSRRFENEWKDVFVHKMGLRTRIPYTRYKKRMLRERINI